MITLYSYFNSSASYRVRIALNLKQLDYDMVYVDLKEGGQFVDEFTKLNPANLVPVCTINNEVISQSLAIIEYIDELYPSVKLLPEDLLLKNKVRSIAYGIACEMQPFGNVRPLKLLRNQFGFNSEQEQQWLSYWITTGFKSIEAYLNQCFPNTHFCCGEKPTLADVCLIPQVYNAKRFNISLNDYPKIISVYEACNQLEAFQKAQPREQADAII